MEIIGKMCLIDNYIWCSCKQQIITVVVSPYQLLIPVVDEDLHCYGGRCEMDGQCFNYDCKYNVNRQISSIRGWLGDESDLDDEKIEKIQSKLEAMTDGIFEDPSLVKKLNEGGCVVFGGDNEGEG